MEKEKLRISMSPNGLIITCSVTRGEFDYGYCGRAYKCKSERKSIYYRMKPIVN